jgi:hypothetical protein
LDKKQQAGLWRNSPNFLSQIGLWRENVYEDCGRLIGLKEGSYLAGIGRCIDDEDVGLTGKQSRQASRWREADEKMINRVDGRLVIYEWL